MCYPISTGISSCRPRLQASKSRIAMRRPANLIYLKQQTNDPPPRDLGEGGIQGVSARGAFLSFAAARATIMFNFVARVEQMSPRSVMLTPTMRVVLSSFSKFEVIAAIKCLQRNAGTATRHGWSSKARIATSVRRAVFSLSRRRLGTRLSTLGWRVATRMSRDRRSAQASRRRVRQ